MLRLVLLAASLLALTSSCAFAQSRPLAKPVLGATQPESRARTVPTKTALVLYDGTDGITGQMRWIGKEKMISLLDVPNLVDIKCGAKDKVTLTFRTRAPARLPWPLPVLAFVDDAFEGCGEVTVQQEGGRNKTVHVPGFLYLKKVAKRNGKTLVLQTKRKPFSSQISELKFELNFQATAQSNASAPSGGRRLQGTKTVRLNYQRDISLYRGYSGGQSLDVKCRQCGPVYTFTITIRGGVRWTCCFWGICVCPKPWATVKLSGSGTLRAELVVRAGYGGTYTIVDKPDFFRIGVPVLGVSGLGVQAFVALGLKGSIFADAGAEASVGVLITQDLWEAYVPAGTGESSYSRGGGISLSRIGPTLTTNGAVGVTLSLSPAFGVSLELIGIDLASVRVGLENSLALGLRPWLFCRLQAYARYTLSPFISGQILGSSATKTFDPLYSKTLYRYCALQYIFPGRKLHNDGSLHSRALALAA